MNNENQRQSYFPLSVQISARAWQEYALPADLLRELPSSALYPLRLLAQSVARRYPQKPVSAGELNLLALLNRTFRFVIGRYLELRACAFGLEAAEIAGERTPLPALRTTLEAFVHLFPPAAVHLGWPAGGFLSGDQGPANRRAAVVELFLLATQTTNPAAREMADLFDDAELDRQARYRQTLSALDSRLGREEVGGVYGGSLLELLQAPLRAAPHSLSGQLEYIQRHWAGILPPDLLRGILTAFDIVQEERQMRGFGAGPIEVPRFARMDFHYEEPERFSPDADWMSNVVMIAKTIYVWLDQLSKKYGRPLTRLDQIPDAELDQLARWGFNALWLIGIWERSPASQKIKQIMGNPEAVSSAYSLYDYVVAHDLGGEEAIADLQERCRRRGIRLGCDVVPNHTGIYSKWTREHPDWFVQVDHPPYPAYQYTRHNLSFSDDIELRVEDGYWNHSDAAVVFQHVDRRSGRVRYIYHGNDGTHLPWNDTAQLNFLLPEVREAMIRTILHVARRYKIIRFDAAMTLAKKHYQRLWFPQPGGGAGVPSRAEHALSREEFDRLFPAEFWREVVDRVAAEVPDTLLLAEAFWLMEGYFVRTLGMHRVYNSAFMNMFKTEDNAKYRSVVKNILDFNPEILKRFVNFMNNPDEATAVEQFGTGGKFFGVSVMLVTMPGLPMYGHGQVEGLREKYGMEYRKAYWDEKVDEGMLRHHEAQIFPLIRRRWLFSGSENFVLYDFFAGDHVNEDVIAYSNRAGGERALVAYHNRHGHTSGWIRTSVPKRVKNGNGEEILITPELSEGLGLPADERRYVRFRDYHSGLEYLRSCRQLAEEGIFLDFGPYQYYVFLDWREIFDEDGSWGWVCQRLEGRPVPSLDTEWKKVRYAPVLDAFRQAVLPGLLKALGDLVTATDAAVRKDPAPGAFERAASLFFQALARTADLPGDPEAAGARLAEDLATLRRLAALKGRSGREKEALEELREEFPEGTSPRRESFYRVLLSWLLLRRTAELDSPPDPQRAAARMEDFLLLLTLQEILSSEPQPPFNLPWEEAAAEALLVQLLVRHLSGGDLDRILPALLADPDTQTYLGCNWYGGVQWFNRERFESLLRALYAAGAVTTAEKEEGTAGVAGRVADLHALLADCRRKAGESGFRFQEFLRALSPKPAPNSPRERKKR